MKWVIEIDGSDFQIWYWTSKYGALCFTHAVKCVLLNMDVIPSLYINESTTDRIDCNICSGKYGIEEANKEK